MDGEAAFLASGCSNRLAFLSTLQPQLQSIQFRDGEIIFDVKSAQFRFPFDGMRAKEERSKKGSFIRFLAALPSSSRELIIDPGGVELASEREVATLFDGIASPSCTLQSLQLYGEVTFSHGADLVGDALCKNTSLTHLLIRSHLIDIEKHLLPRCLTRPHSHSLTSLEVWLHHHQTLDVLLPIFSALALNTLSLTHLRVCGSANKQAYTCEAQLGTMLSTNNSLVDLLFVNLYMPGTLVHSLLSSLESNVHLTHLSLQCCGGEGWPTANSLLDCLRVNASLQVLDLDKTPLLLLADAHSQGHPKFKDKLW